MTSSQGNVQIGEPTAQAKLAASQNQQDQEKWVNEMNQQQAAPAQAPLNPLQEVQPGSNDQFGSNYEWNSLGQKIGKKLNQPSDTPDPKMDAAGIPIAQPAFGGQ